MTIATSELAVSFTALGSLMIAGLVAQWLGQKTAIPRVSLLIGLGIIAGPTGADLISTVAQKTFPWISHVTLAMVGFLLGGKLHVSFLRRQGQAILSSSLWITLLTWGIVTLVCAWLTGDWALALLIGAIATATDPAATRDVILESKTQNLFTDRLLGIVSLDDVWGLLIFSLSVSLAGFMLATGSGAALLGLWELFGALILGLAMGLPVAWLTARSSDGEPLLVEALGAVLLCAGLAELLSVSYLLSCIVMGAVVTNAARHHNRPFHAIEQIEWPFMMLFFILAGASLDIDAVTQLGSLGAAYVASRILGRLLGGIVCSRRQQWPLSHGLALGGALLPQAGIAIGIALIGSQAFPEYADQLLTTAIAGTVIFELMGPPLTRRSLGYMSGK